MMRYFFLTVILVSCLFACTMEPPAELTQAIEEVRAHYAPDRRVARFEVATIAATNVLRGSTNLPAAKDSLLRRLASLGLEWEDSISVWPSSSLGEDTFALVRHSVANIRTKKGHSEELTTQALLGTPLKVLMKDGDWYLVQTPDYYIAWLDSGGLELMNIEEIAAWKAAERVIYTFDFGFSYTAANAGSKPLGDLVAGCILVRDSILDLYSRVRYPDGRIGYVQNAFLTPFDTWLTERSEGFEHVYAAAERLRGRPYLWGGTSPKGMDCSGFTKTVYWQQGIIIPRDASQQVHTGVDISLDNDLEAVQAGDFLFFGNYRDDGSERITHVGIYVGNGRFIHSGADNGAIRVESLLADTPDYAPHRRESLMRARRLKIGEDGVQAVRLHDWYW